MDTLTTLLQDLVKINSINPDLVTNGAGEGAHATYIAEWGRHEGFEVIVQNVAENRPNVILIARGTGGGKSLMFNAHTDTVGVADMDDPFKPVLRDGRVYGRGAYDMKGSLVACMQALKNAQKMSLKGDVILTAVVDEEYASIGTKGIINEWDQWSADAVIVTEPTELEISIAHKGFVWLEIETFGKAAHGSRPYLGVDAIAKMGKILVRLEELDLHLRANPTHDLLQSGSLHASTIQGGEELSMYPAYCKLMVERRTIPGETPEFVQAQIQSILDELAQADSSFSASVKTIFEGKPFGVNRDEPIVEILHKNASHILQRDVPLVGSTFWMDAALLSAQGIPTVVLGPLGEGAHAKVEWVDLQSVAQCVDIYTACIRDFCT